MDQIRVIVRQVDRANVTVRETQRGQFGEMESTLRPVKLDGATVKANSKPVQSNDDGADGLYEMVLTLESTSVAAKFEKKAYPLEYGPMF